MYDAGSGKGVADEGQGGLGVIEGGETICEGFDFLDGFGEKGGDGSVGAEGETEDGDALVPGEEGDVFERGGKFGGVAA